MTFPAGNPGGTAAGAGEPNIQVIIIKDEF